MEERYKTLLLKICYNVYYFRTVLNTCKILELPKFKNNNLRINK